MFVATRRSWIVLASAMMLGSVGSPAQLLSISTSPAINSHNSHKQTCMLTEQQKASDTATCESKKLSRR